MQMASHGGAGASLGTGTSSKVGSLAYSPFQASSRLCCAPPSASSTKRPSSCLEDSRYGLGSSLGSSSLSVGSVKSRGRLPSWCVRPQPHVKTSPASEHASMWWLPHRSALMAGSPTTSRGLSTGGLLAPKPRPHSSALPHVKTLPLTSAADDWLPPPSHEAPVVPRMVRGVKTPELAYPTPICPSPLRPQPRTLPFLRVRNVPWQEAKTLPTPAPSAPVRHIAWGTSSALFSSSGTVRSGRSTMNVTLPAASALNRSRPKPATPSSVSAVRYRTTGRGSARALYLATTPPPGLASRIAFSPPTSASSTWQPLPSARPSWPVALEPQAKAPPPETATTVWFSPLATLEIVPSSLVSTTAGS
mmetsp:Transcript_102252/g.305272  ORF Transcript_102252/g.305272 Transcript_102252/m.305272 type:complete len:361 (-) Transcript_102252:434-1516(-)